MTTAAGGVPTRSTASWNEAIESLLATAHWLFARKSYRHAESTFRAALLYAWKDERAWLGFGACREVAGQREAALAIYGAARSVCRPGVRVHLARARVLRALGRPEESAEALAAATDAARASGDEWLESLVTLERALHGPEG